jgi:hypothetical protein
MVEYVEDEYALPPRILTSLIMHPSYVKEDIYYDYEGKQISFKIIDDRQAHWTSSKISGIENEENKAEGYAILYNKGKFLLEIWNDGELNCWSEFDLESRKQIYLRKNELFDRLEKYIPELEIRQAYINEIEKDYSEEAFSVSHYYFESDMKKDETILLDSLEGIIDINERWDIVKKLSEERFKNNEREQTWRGLCLLIQAHKLFFRGTSIEPIILAEQFLIGNTALGWGGKSQKSWINLARKFRPITIKLFEMTNEKDREREIWNALIYDLLTSIIFSSGIKQYYPKKGDYEVIIRLTEAGDDKDRLMTKTLFKWLIKNKFITYKERVYLKKQPLLR